MGKAGVRAGVMSDEHKITSGLSTSSVVTGVALIREGHLTRGTDDGVEGEIQAHPVGSVRRRSCQSQYAQRCGGLVDGGGFEPRQLAAGMVQSPIIDLISLKEFEGLERSNKGVTKCGAQGASWG
jgi:hypothetical protein